MITVDDVQRWGLGDARCTSAFPSHVLQACSSVLLWTCIHRRHLQFVNAATVVFLLWFPENKRMETLVYALADGPLAAALLAWQCPWVFGSIEHAIR